MKQKKFSGKLNFQKTTIATLDNQAKNNVKGGYLWTRFWGDCETWAPNCPTLPYPKCSYIECITAYPCTDDCPLP